VWQSLVASILVGILKAWWSREDFRASVFREVERQQAHAALAAMGWQVDALARPDRGAHLGVRDDSRIILPGRDPDPPRRPE
jgi:hypothetical protein